jgi:hypothetical protein
VVPLVITIDDQVCLRCFADDGISSLENYRLRTQALADQRLEIVASDNRDDQLQLMDAQSNVWLGSSEINWITYTSVDPCIPKVKSYLCELYRKMELILQLCG